MVFVNKNKLLRVKDFILPSDRQENKSNFLENSVSVFQKPSTSQSSIFSYKALRRLLLTFALQNSEKVTFRLLLLGYPTEKYAKVCKEQSALSPTGLKNFERAKTLRILSQKLYICRYNTVVPTVFWYSTYNTNYTIVRPLMNCLRSEITVACVLNLLPVYPDFSNLKMQYSRNRIRKQIIPAIKFFFNPKAEKALFQFSEFYNKKTF